MNEISVVPNTLPTTTQVQAESARAMAREQRVYANALMATRDPKKMIAELEFYCGTREMAEAAFYSYTRGDTVIEGPTIKLLRAVACAFGHVRSGWRVLELRETEADVQAFAEDMKKGILTEIEFTVRFWRETNKGGYAITSDRDKYELMANMASRRVRRCLEDVIPATFINYADRACRKVLATQGTIEDRIAAMIEKFAEIGVSESQLAAKLRHPVQSASEGEITRLGKLYRAIVDGITAADEQFAEPVPDPEATLKSKALDAPATEGVGTKESEEIEETPKKRGPKPGKANRADITALIEKALEHDWPNEDAVKNELRDLGIAKPSDLEKTRIQETLEHLCRGPRGSWTHMYWMGTRCQLNRDGVLQMIQDTTGADIDHGGQLETVEINAIYEELDNRILAQQQAALSLGVPDEGGQAADDDAQEGGDDD